MSRHPQRGAAIAPTPTTRRRSGVQCAIGYRKKGTIMGRPVPPHQPSKTLRMKNCLYEPLSCLVSVGVGERADVAPSRDRHLFLRHHLLAEGSYRIPSALGSTIFLRKVGRKRSPKGVKYTRNYLNHLIRQPQKAVLEFSWWKGFFNKMSLNLVSEYLQCK